MKMSDLGQLPNWESACKNEARNVTKYKRMSERLFNVLADIEEKGHRGGYHGHGYTLATIAGDAIMRFSK